MVNAPRRLRRKENMEYFEAEVKKLRELTLEDFEAYINPLRDRIYSFPGLYPPGDAKYIGSVQRQDDIYNYYMDSEGELYYESASGFREKKRMRDVHIKLLRT